MTTENTILTASGILIPFLQKPRSIHFIGICGASMRGLAVACLLQGHTVTGSDSARGEAEAYLAAHDITVEEPAGGGTGISAADLAVFSLAVPYDHPELITARRRGILIASRADLLSAILAPFACRVGIAGTHGKSTVSAMCGKLLERAGRSPTVFLGASLSKGEDGFHPGGGDLAVFEACEYRSSFLSFSPTVAVLTNTEWDHPDCFGDHAAMLDAYGAYLLRPTVRQAVISADDPDALALAGGLSVPIISFGLSPMADVCASELESVGPGISFLLAVKGESWGRVHLGVRGEHNVKNALAAFAVAHALGIRSSPDALADFCGVGRRLTLRGVRGGVTYYEDYAHHPSEIRATLAALRSGEGRLICIFQPHTYTRTAAFFADFAEALSGADSVVVTDIYAARETNTVGVSARALAAACGSHALYLASPEAAALSVRSRAVAGDTVVVMGAGDIAARFFGGALAF